MKQLPLFMLICCLLSACRVGVSQDFVPPTPMVIVPTAVAQQSEALSPTAAEEVGETVVATPLPIDNSELSPGSTGTQFDNLYFANTGHGLPQSIFANGTEVVFAIWDYADLSEADVVRRVWLKDRAEWLVREEAWDVAAYGSSGTVRDISVYDYEGSGLESGSYQLILYVNDSYQASAAFQIQAGVGLATSLEASTETQLAWVQDNNVLMLDAWDGSQRELVQVHKIVELLWLPDGRHLLYVDQRAAEPDGPPWPHHALWIVDTETAVSHQLSAFGENLHRIAFSPNAGYIRALPGSDFGDACFMDRGLVFLELDEHYERVALHDFRDFEGVPADEGYWLFPEDEGKGVSDHEYEVDLTANCLAAEMGASEADLGLIGRYRLDLERRTAVKIGD